MNFILGITALAMVGTFMGEASGDDGLFVSLPSSQLRTARVAPHAIAALDYSADGFEAFALGSIAGQQGWIVDIDQSRFQIQNNLGVGSSKAVQVVSSGVSHTMDWSYPTTTSHTPGSDELVRISTDFARTLDPSGSFRSSLAYMTEVRNSSYVRTFRFGLTVDENGAPAVGVTTRWSPELGFDPSAPITSVIISESLDQDVFYNFEARADYATKTFDLFNNGEIFWADLPFADQEATTFQHAALAYERGPAPSVFDYGLFDNYSVEFVPVQVCLADTNGDGILSPADFSAWVAAFNVQGTGCDQNSDASCTPADFSAWVANYNAGCP